MPVRRPFSLVRFPVRPVRVHHLAGCALAILSSCLFAANAAATTLSVPGSMSLSTALASAQDGDVIEIDPGTYVPPAGGFVRGNGLGHIVIRPSGAGTVIIDGQGNKPLMRLENSSPVTGSVRIEDITFQNGLSVTDGRAGGVSMQDVRVTFVRCSFKNNQSAAPNTGGGGIFLYGDDSRVHIFDGYFEGNTAINEGGALRVGDDTLAVVTTPSFAGTWSTFRTTAAPHQEAQSTRRTPTCSSRTRPFTKTRQVASRGPSIRSVCGRTRPVCRERTCGSSTPCSSSMSWSPIRP